MGGGGIDDEWPFPETRVASGERGIGLSIFVPPAEGSKEVVENGNPITIGIDVPGTRVLGTLSDESIGPDGQLLRSP